MSVRLRVQNAIFGGNVRANARAILLNLTFLYLKFPNFPSCSPLSEHLLVMFSLRKEGDSNPRSAFDAYTLSRRASSTTRAPFQGKLKFLKANQKYLLNFL